MSSSISNCAFPRSTAAAVDRGNAQLLIEELMSKVYDLQNVQPAVEKEEKNDDIGFFMDLFEWDKKK